MKSSSTSPSSSTAPSHTPSIVSSASVSKLIKWSVVSGVIIALIAIAHAHHPGVAQDPESRITRQYNAQVVDRQAYLPSWKRDRLLDGSLDLKLENEGGEESRLSQFKGEVVLLNFWASWCETCQEEIPDFEALVREMKLEGRPFRVVMVSADDQWGELRAAISRALMRDFGALPPHKINLDLYRDPMSSDEKQHRNYGTYKFPESYVIDKSGRVRLRFINTMPIRTGHGGKREWNDELVSYLKWLTRE